MQCCSLWAAGRWAWHNKQWCQLLQARCTWHARRSSAWHCLAHGLHGAFPLQAAGPDAPPGCGGAGRAPGGGCRSRRGAAAVQALAAAAQKRDASGIAGFPVVNTGLAVRRRPVRAPGRGRAGGRRGGRRNWRGAVARGAAGSRASARAGRRGRVPGGRRARRSDRLPARARRRVARVQQPAARGVRSCVYRLCLAEEGAKGE